MRVLLLYYATLPVDECERQKRKLLEYIANEGQIFLAVGAIRELCMMLNDEPEWAISIYEKLIGKMPEALFSHDGPEFIYFAMYRHLERVEPFIRTLLNSSDDPAQQRGAELAVLASLSRLEHPNTSVIERMRSIVSSLFEGPTQWRRGAAHIYDVNATSNTNDPCINGLRLLLDDPDQGVARFVCGVFTRFGGSHFYNHRDFILEFARSMVITESRGRFAKYLWEFGMLDPIGSLTIIDTLLNNPHLRGVDNWQLGSEALVRLTVQIYNNPTINADMRSQAMDLFDKLAERYRYDTQRVLYEWDRK